MSDSQTASPSEEDDGLNEDHYNVTEEINSLPSNVQKEDVTIRGKKKRRKMNEVRLSKLIKKYKIPPKESNNRGARKSIREIEIECRSAGIWDEYKELLRVRKCYVCEYYELEYCDMILSPRLCCRFCAKKQYKCLPLKYGKEIPFEKIFPIPSIYPIRDYIRCEEAKPNPEVTPSLIKELPEDLLLESSLLDGLHRAVSKHANHRLLFNEEYHFSSFDNEMLMSLGYLTEEITRSILEQYTLPKSSFENEEESLHDIPSDFLNSKLSMKSTPEYPSCKSSKVDPLVKRKLRALHRFDGENGKEILSLIKSINEVEAAKEASYDLEAEACTIEHSP